MVVETRDEVVENSKFRRRPSIRTRTTPSISISMDSFQSNITEAHPPLRQTRKIHNALYVGSKNFGRKFVSFASYVLTYRPSNKVLRPSNEDIQQWKKFLAIFCLVAIFVDPLFFFSAYVKKDDKCIAINWTMTTILVVLRSINDFIYFFHILLKFRLAYDIFRESRSQKENISHESRVVGATDSVKGPKKNANYLKGYFLIDLYVVSPFPQIVIFLLLPQYLGSFGVIYSALLGGVVLVQYFLRLFSFLRLLIDQSPTGFIFKSDWAKVIVNLLIFVLFGHLVGAFWYLFGLQRVNQCLRNACSTSNITGCLSLIGCIQGRASSQQSVLWSNDVNATTCLKSSSGAFSYGIYVNAVPLTMETRVMDKYVFALFWGFQQTSTLAGNLTPSYYVWEVVFTMVIIGLGLSLFAFLIGKIQKFLERSVARTKMQSSVKTKPVKKRKKAIKGESSRSQHQVEEEELDPTTYDEDDSEITTPLSPPPSTMAKQLRELRCDNYDIQQRLEANQRSMDFLVEQFRNYAAFTAPTFPFPSAEEYATFVAWPVLPGGQTQPSQEGGSEAANDDGGIGTSSVVAKATKGQEQVGGDRTQQDAC